MRRQLERDTPGADPRADVAVPVAHLSRDGRDRRGRRVDVLHRGQPLAAASSASSRSRWWSAPIWCAGAAASPAADAGAGGVLMDVCLLSARRLGSALAGGEVSAVEVLEAVLQRADRLSGPINPFAVRLDDRARAAAVGRRCRARRGDRRTVVRHPADDQGLPLPRGGDRGGGLAVAAALRAHRDVGGGRTARGRGAVIFAKTTTPEFCYFGITDSPVNGRTNNPWDLERTPGGSSGGAGAAVAAGLGRSRWAATGAARSASPRRSAASSASSRRSGSCRASRAPWAGRRWSPTVRWRARWTTRG